MRLIAGRYELQKELGAGGMGAVWLGHDQVLGRSVAIKEIRLAATGATKLTAAAFREARAAAALNHTHIVPVYDVVEYRSRPWIVMLAVEGLTLQQRVQADGPIDPDVIAAVGVNLASALDAAHGQGIVHRDVKPSNVMLAQDEHPWLVDFGIAQPRSCGTIDETSALVDGPPIISRAAKGSAGYAAPEQVRGDPPEPPVDVFGLGATLYYAVEGEHAFSGDDAWATLMAPQFETPRRPRRAGRLGSILLRMMARQPDERPTLEEVQTALRLPPRRTCFPPRRRHSGAAPLGVTVATSAR
ncbi:serine/threonine-protein kinase [Cryptosporangium sp. NPDC048952]|uniref:serine/threonine-protein kinase n=1 Tax=Cryptosporangium sp. NPDC048952 TaxID=3363961 RepID=UPI0037112088